MIEADWLWGLAGGLMIGVAGALYLLVNGRIMGASGIVGGLVDGSGRNTWPERAAFVAALIAVPLALRPAFPAAATHLTGNIWAIGVAGLLVGVGTRMANGCTSGHGVCGISRLSVRGIVATLTFILAGGVTLALLRHVWAVI
jgi:uncharacterized protein